MKRKFVMMPAFDNQWKLMGLTDDDLRELQERILENPKIGDVVKGTGGLRKMRFALPGKGKSSGSRVVYVDFTEKEITYLIFAYPKNMMDNLTKEECNSIKKLIEQIRKSL